MTASDEKRRLQRAEQVLVVGDELSMVYQSFWEQLKKA